VLVVEDDTDMNELECQILSMHGFRPVPAFTGREALDAWDRDNVDAILLDIMLPELDGYETCRRIRGSGARQVPIVMVTALDGEESRRLGAEAGADAFFRKPFNPDEVISTLRELLSGGTGA
jgi:DNA-binding response OmpR family regulator